MIRYCYFSLKKIKKEETQSSVSLFSLILYTTKYTVKLHKKSPLYFSAPILSKLYSTHFSICISKLDYIYFYTTCILFSPWSITNTWATLSESLLTHIKALSTKH